MMHNKTTLLLAMVVAHFASVTLSMPSSHAADVLVSIGDGSGAPGSKNNKVTIFLDNARPVKGLELIISDQGNFLSCNSCQAIARASDFNCGANEKRFGYTIIELMSTGGLIDEGTGPVLDLLCDVKKNAAPGDCFTLRGEDKNSVAAGERQTKLTVKSVPGEFCITGGGEDETTTAPATTTAGGGTTSILNPAPTTITDSSSNTPSLPDGGGIVPTLSDRGENVQQAPDSLEKEGSGTRSTPRRSSTATSIRAQAPSKAQQQAEGLQDIRAATTVPPASPYRLVISPSVAKLYSGDMMQFAAKTLLEGGEVEGRYAWQLVPPSTIGSSISAAGEFTAGNNPNDTPVLESIYVTDTLNGNSAELALITIERLDRSASDCSLKLSPSSATIPPGKSITFAARTVGATCKEGSYTWRINSTIGSRIDESGCYTAGDNQSGHNALDIILIKDAENRLSADAIVTVVAGDIDSTSRSATDQTPRFAGRYFNLFVGIIVLAALLGIALVWKFKR